MSVDRRDDRAIWFKAGISGLSSFQHDEIAWFLVKDILYIYICILYYIYIYILRSTMDRLVLKVWLSMELDQYVRHLQESNRVRCFKVKI